MEYNYYVMKKKNAILKRCRQSLRNHQNSPAASMAELPVENPNVALNDSSISSSSAMSMATLHRRNSNKNRDGFAEESSNFNGSTNNSKSKGEKPSSNCSNRVLNRYLGGQQSSFSSTTIAIYEIAVYFGDLRKWVKGVDDKTTSDEVIKAILAESNIDVNCSPEYFIVIEDNETKNQSPLSKHETILPHWNAIEKSKDCRFLLTAQRFYVNITAKPTNSNDATAADKEEKMLARVKMYSYLADQLGVIENQERRLDSLDHELTKLKQTPTAQDTHKSVSEIERLEEMSRYGALASMLASKTRQMIRQEEQLLSNRKASMTGSDRGVNQMIDECNASSCTKSDLERELKRAEIKGHQLNEELRNLLAAEKELENLLKLKKKHYADVEKLITSKSSDMGIDRHFKLEEENNVKSSAGRQKPDLNEEFAYPSKLSGKIIKEQNRYVLQQKGFMGHNKSKFDFGNRVDQQRAFAAGIDSIHDAGDDDSDTGVSSMNSDDSILVAQLAEQIGSGKEEYTHLETLV